MTITLERRAEREWLIKVGEETIGEVSRKQTGYLVKKYENDEVIKRFRLIDALRQTFGEEHTYVTPEDTKTSEEGYV